MKKTLSIIIAAVLALSALVCLASCGGSGGIVGKWTAKIDYGKMMESEEGAEMLNALGMDLSGKTVDLNVEFKEDGKFSLSADKDQIKAIMKEFYEKMIPSFASMMGVSEEEYLEQSGYSSVDEAVEGMMSEQQTDDGMLSGEGTYEYKDGTLTIKGESESTVKVELSGDTLTFKEVVGESEVFSQELLPLVFNRK